MELRGPPIRAGSRLDRLDGLCDCLRLGHVELRDERRVGLAALLPELHPPLHRRRRRAGRAARMDERIAGSDQIQDVYFDFRGELARWHVTASL